MAKRQIDAVTQNQKKVEFQSPMPTWSAHSSPVDPAPKRQAAVESPARTTSQGSQGSQEPEEAKMVPRRRLRNVTTAPEPEVPTRSVQRSSTAGLVRRTSVKWSVVGEHGRRKSSKQLTRHKSFDDVLRRLDVDDDGDDDFPQRHRSGMFASESGGDRYAESVPPASFAGSDAFDMCTTQTWHGAGFDRHEPQPHEMTEDTVSCPARPDEAQQVLSRTISMDDYEAARALSALEQVDGGRSRAGSAAEEPSRSGYMTPPAQGFVTPTSTARRMSSFSMPDLPPLFAESPSVTPRGKLSPLVPDRPQRGINDFLSLTPGPGADDNDCRFEREFDQRTRIGEGHFSIVYKARNTVDQCCYAVKRTKQRIVAPGQTPNQRHIKEAFALATMERGDPCPNIVRYFSSWFESGQLYIQMELCETTLRCHMQALVSSRPDPRFTPAELVDVMSQVANGLDCMHSLNFVHLDIKPDNILLARTRHDASRWKIGDLGLAEIALKGGYDDICEGDSRYLAREVLNGDLSRLTAGDVFSLGLMVYELGTNPELLPGGGDQWHELREGKLNAALLPSLPPSLWELMQMMVNEYAEDRPTCAEILEHPGCKAPAEELSLCDASRIEQELKGFAGTELDGLRRELKVAEEQAAFYARRAEELRRAISERLQAGAAAAAPSQGREVTPEDDDGLTPPKVLNTKVAVIAPRNLDSKDPDGLKGASAEPCTPPGVIVRNSFS